MNSKPWAFSQDAFNSAPVGMLVVDSRGAIVDLNRQLEALSRYSREELIGQPVELLVDGLAEVHQAHRERFVARPETRPMGVGRDLFARRRDGVRVPVEVGLTPLQTPTGLFVLASIVDLTERRRAEEQFRLAIEAAPNGMMLVDEMGKIVLINAQIEQLFGYTRAELVGMSVDALLPDRLREGHDAKRGAFFAAPLARPMGAGRELFARARGGREFPIEIGLSPLRTASGVLVLAAIVDITERLAAREQLRASLQEKETLLAELEHRAKNNLQLIASLLDLAVATPSPDVVRECRDRINSIALVHEKLYQAGTMARIEMSDYLRSLAEQVAHSWGRVDDPVHVSIEATDLWLPLESATPCGLIINELLTNSFKHAFPGTRSGKITVRARRDENQVNIIVEDDGIGHDGKSREGHLGLQLVSALTRQLRATLVFDASRGTRVTLTFQARVS